MARSEMTKSAKWGSAAKRKIDHERIGERNLESKGESAKNGRDGEKERNVEKREKSREKRENKVLLRVVDRGKEGLDREGKLGGRRQRREREKGSAWKTEMMG